MSRKSIFELEKRISPIEETKRVLSYIQLTDVFKLGTYSPTLPFISIIDLYFMHWPYRNSSLSCKDYLSLYGINLKNPTQEDCLYLLEFFLNMCIWIPDRIVYSNTSYSGIKFKNNEIIAGIYNSILSILEGLNYTNKSLKDRTILCKRNSDVDSTIDLIKDKNLSDLLLQYLDFRIQNNSKEKGSILASINIWIEKNKEEYKKSNHSLYKEISAIINNIGSRHKENIDPPLTDEEKIYWMDKCFHLMLHLIRSTEISKISKEIDEKFKPRIAK